ncbi:MAG TPA: SCE4755 family polysaccharide monooxygenase-like protein [Polyangia bacterium]|nr:SCE4755 family polysaccharide monooxygenase-like protein [Polyangia bacterium]
MRVFALVTGLLLTFSTAAHAHFQLMSPPAVVAADPNGKGNPPCGPDTGMAAMPMSVQGGHPLKIIVYESVGHKGFYRVALALKSRSELPVDNVVYNAAGAVLPADGTGDSAKAPPVGESARADTEKLAVFPVLADDFYHHDTAVSGKLFDTGSVDIPNVNCDRCTLQVVEFMFPHTFNRSNPPPGGGYFYHHCAELKITADPALPMFGADGGAPDAPAADGGGGTAMGSGGTAGMDAAAQPGSGGSNGTGGQSASGGASGTDGSGGKGSPGGSSSSSSSGGCTVAASSTMGVGSLMALALAITLARRRRRQ